MLSALCAWPVQSPVSYVMSCFLFVIFAFLTPLLIAFYFNCPSSFEAARFSLCLQLVRPSVRSFIQSYLTKIST